MEAGAYRALAQHVLGQWEFRAYGFALSVLGCRVWGDRLGARLVSCLGLKI